MVHKIKKYLFALTALFIVVSASSQNRTDSVSFNNTEVVTANTSKTLLIGFDKCSGLVYQYNSVKLYNYLSLGKDYKFGTVNNNASVTLQIDIYNTPSGGSGLMQTYTGITLAINRDTPEKEYIRDITSLVKAGAVRVVITAI